MRAQAYPFVRIARLQSLWHELELTLGPQLTAPENGVCLLHKLSCYENYCVCYIKCVNRMEGASIGVDLLDSLRSQTEPPVDIMAACHPMWWRMSVYDLTCYESN